MQNSHRARKRFGQNFLTDPAIIDNIVAAIRPVGQQHLVEIGPGQAALTNPIAEQLDASSRLTLIELDRDLATKLQQHFANNSCIQVIQADALFFDFVAHKVNLPNCSLRIFGNLPYNISTPLLFHLLEQHARTDQSALIDDMHFMLQKEVVARMSASPGGKDYGRLSVMTQYHCQVEPLFDVPSTAFKPQPKVTSAVVRLLPHATKPLRANCEKTLDIIVKSGFSQRRKTIRNTLKTHIDEQQLLKLNIDPSRRAETLSLAEFVAIANVAAP